MHTDNVHCANELAVHEKQTWPCCYTGRLRHAERSCCCCRYCAGEDVLEQAFRLNFAPCIVIRGHLLTLLGLSKQVPWGDMLLVCAARKRCGDTLTPK